MASDLGAIRHALALARDRGFVEVVVESDDLKFKAVLEPAPKKRVPSATPTSSNEAEGEAGATGLVDIVSPLVGYFRASDPPIAVGDKVATGQVIGVIASLGDIPYGVEATTDGEVASFEVEPGHPVMYGQTIVQIRP